MTSRRRQGSGVAWLLAVGAALVVLGLLAVGAGVSSKVYVNYLGQQGMPVLAIASGIAVLLVPVVLFVGRIRQRLVLRQLERRRGR